MFEATAAKLLRTITEASIDTGIADATSLVNRLDDASKNWPVDAFTDLIVEITGGTGEGQIRKIASNAATSLVPVTNFVIAPDATSTYRIGFFGKMSGDITNWGGTALTGRDISLDLKSLTDDSITGILKSIGDIAALENLVTRIGQTTDAIVAAGAGGSIAAKLRRATQGLEDLKTLIVLAAGANIIGKVGIDQTTPGTTDRVTANVDKIGGIALTGRDISLDLAKLTPVEKANEHNTAELADTDILGAALSPTNTPCLFRVMVTFDAAGIFRATITKGGNTQVVNLNSGNNLIANAVYMFDHLVHAGDTINYRYSVDAQLLVLRVQEIVAGVQ